MESKPLTDQQYKVLQYIDKHLHAKGFPPTLQEIGVAIGLNHVNAVRGHVLALEKKGYITKAPDRARSIQIIKPLSTLSRLKRRMHKILKTDQGVYHQVVYALAWVTHLKKPYFEKTIRDAVIKSLSAECMKRGWELIQTEIAPDHISLVVKVWPNHSPQLVVRRCQNSLKNLIKQTTDLQSDKRLWGKGYVATTSLDLLPQMIERLMNNQSSNSIGDGK
ncbi:MAG: transposase [Deltaproteobacteria bacterium]|nr:transposase [Deltaproteobacteria bacterium]